MEHPDLDLLGRTELFRGASIEMLRNLHAASFGKRCAAGERLFAQGDEATSLYVITVGRLRASQTTPDGQQVTMRYLGPGEVVGYTTLTADERHPGDVTAVADSWLIGWSRSVIREAMAQNSIVAINAVAMLGARYHDMQSRLRELATERVEQRIAHAILRLARTAGRRSARGIEIAFPVTRQDLAEIAGTTLHTVSRTLSAWEEQGVVDCGRRRVVLCKADALETIAADS